MHTESPSVPLAGKHSHWLEVICAKQMNEWTNSSTVLQLAWWKSHSIIQHFSNTSELMIVRLKREINWNWKNPRIEKKETLIMYSHSRMCNLKCSSCGCRSVVRKKKRTRTCACEDWVPETRGKAPGQSRGDGDSQVTTKGCNFTNIYKSVVLNRFNLFLFWNDLLLPSSTAVMALFTSAFISSNRSSVLLCSLVN